MTQLQHVDFVLALDMQQHPSRDTAKKCPRHGGILAVSKAGTLYCADMKARTCDYQEMGLIEH